jgi:phosphoribosylformimino-5-aminoimidazole carboxamide ribotide isomerase
MLILPAIDILGGECVRLYKGEYGTARKVAEDPFTTVERFLLAGATYIHMVDLDGAKTGQKVNADLFCALAKKSSIPIELGGGIRDMETVTYYIDNGIARIILGSAAIKNPKFLKEAIETYGEKIAVGIDAKNGFVSVSGWLENSDVNYIEFAKKMEQLGVKNIIFTDISRDGTLEGPNLQMLRDLQAQTRLDITASGGIKNIEDIADLSKMKLYGAIVGRSIYDGTLDLMEAVKRCEKED